MTGRPPQGGATVPAEPTLERIQHTLRRLVTARDGAAAPPARGDGTPGAGPSLLRTDRGIAPAERVAVYANAWFARLHDALREDFPALAHALGADAFHDLVRTYLMRHPPHRPSLRDAGAGLPAHLRTPPFAGIFARRRPFAADLARLEWALVDAFDAPDAAPLGADAFAGIDPEAWASLRFELSPSLQRLDCEWPVHEVRQAHDRAETGAAPPPSLAPRPTALCVWRRDERVHYRALPPLEAEALAAVASGTRYGRICEKVADAVGERRAPRRAADLLHGWVESGLVTGLRQA